MTRTVYCTVDEENNRLNYEEDAPAVRVGEQEYLRIVALVPKTWTRKIRKAWAEKFKGYKFGNCYIQMHGEKVKPDAQTEKGEN